MKPKEVMAPAVNPSQVKKSKFIEGLHLIKYIKAF
jgi:hypothetical protein